MSCSQLALWLLPLAALGQSQPSTVPAIAPDRALEIVRSIPAPDPANPPAGMRAALSTIRNRVRNAQAGLFCTECRGTGIVSKKITKRLKYRPRPVIAPIPGTEKPCETCQATGVPVDQVPILLNSLARAVIWCPREKMNDSWYFQAWEQFDVLRYGEVCEPVLLAVNRYNTSVLAKNERGAGIMVYGRSFAQVDTGGCSIVGCELPGTNERFAFFVEGECKEVVGSLIRVVGAMWGKLPDDAEDLAGLPLIYSASVNRVELLQFNHQKLEWQPAPEGHQIPGPAPADE